MSDDPETARQIAELSLDTRPLLVLDVDDVLMDFIQPFIRYLDGRGYKLPLRSFKLTGNLARKDTGELVDKDGVSELLNTFFAAQADWQVAAPGSVETLQAFNSDVEIVMLTARCGASTSTASAFPTRCSPPKRRRARRSASCAAQAAARWPSSTTSRTTSPRPAPRWPTRISFT